MWLYVISVFAAASSVALGFEDSELSRRWLAVSLWQPRRAGDKRRHTTTTKIKLMKVIIKLFYELRPRSVRLTRLTRPRARAPPRT